jgi:hypothetical protein
MTDDPKTPLYLLFAGDRRVATGPADEIAARFHDLEAAGERSLLVIERETGRAVDLPRPGAAAPETLRRGPGRPKLGVVAREVTLLPGHWDWLSRQPGGASTTLRRLVDEARRTRSPAQARREARDAAYYAMSALAGNREGFESATRALYAGDRDAFEALAAAWPADIAQTLREMAGPGFGTG